MISVDASVFLRALIRPADAEIQQMHQAAVTLFRRAETEELEITTSDAVVAKVASVLVKDPLPPWAS